MNPEKNGIPYLSVARFEGEDAGPFLHAQLSADITGLEPGETTLACYCTPNGKVLGLLLAGRVESGYLLAGSSELLPGILQRLKMFVLRSKVVIAEAPNLSVTGSAGPSHAFSRDSEAMLDTAAWRAAELRAGITWLNGENREKYIPQMLGFDEIGAVSFGKGCYPGQEIVARARYLGKVKRKPLILEIDESLVLKTGEKVKVLRGQDTSDAVVVDSAVSDRDSTVVFTIAAEEAGMAVEALEYGGRSYRCATT